VIAEAMSGLRHITGDPDRPPARVLGDPRFDTLIARSRNAKDIDEVVKQWTLRHTTSEVEEKLTAAEVPASRIYTIADVFEDPHYRSRGMLVDAPDDDFGSVTLAAPVPRLSRTPGRILISGGRIGQHTRAVLSELACYTKQELDKLESDGVISCDRATGAIGSGGER
jgi:crotonobetainyl-CoA:carnitine CoA-transferase CaiB-like acyl-CoA transferase